MDPLYDLSFVWSSFPTTHQAAPARKWVQVWVQGPLDAALPPVWSAVEDDTEKIVSLPLLIIAILCISYNAHVNRFAS